MALLSGAERVSRAEISPLNSFIIGGFECASHVRRDRRRLDLLASTRHDQHTYADFRLLESVGIRTVRDGLRWHRIEASPGVYDWSSFLPMLRAAHESGTEVIWDLCHWGVPDWLDPFSNDFSERFERFARAAAEVISAERHREAISSTVYICPINEISFWSWVGGDVEHFAPFGCGRGFILKRQLARATIRALKAVREILPHARFLQAEPLINVSAATRHKHALAAAQAHHSAQFEAWDMIAGRLEPELGGSEELLDIIGVNYYWNNQWVRNKERTPLGHPTHEPLHKLLLGVQERYRRPMLLSETGAEGDAAIGWFGMIGAEVRRARALGANIQGICVYPVTDYPGWDNNRHVCTGLISLDRKYEQRSLRSEHVAEIFLQEQLIRQAC